MIPTMAKIPVSKKHRFPANSSGASNSEDVHPMSGIVSKKTVAKAAAKIHQKNQKKSKK